MRVKTTYLRATERTPWPRIRVATPAETRDIPYPPDWPDYVTREEVHLQALIECGLRSLTRYAVSEHARGYWWSVASPDN